MDITKEKIDGSILEIVLNFNKDCALKEKIFFN